MLSQLAPEELLRPVEARFDSSLRTSRNSRDFPVGQVFVVVKQQRRLQIVRQRLNRAAYLFNNFDALELLDWGAFNCRGFSDSKTRRRRS